MRFFAAAPTPTRAAELYEQSGEANLAAEARFYLSRIEEEETPVENGLYLPGTSVK